MTLLPIVVRELRISARRPATYWLRTALAGLAAGSWLLLLLVSAARSTSADLAKALFAMVSVVALAFGLFAGVFLTADAISQERREGTLGLLFLTPLRAYDVIAGKLIAASLPATFGLLSVFPVLALPLLMGGVSFGQFCRVCLVLLSTLGWSLCLGTAISVFCREARQAMSMTLLFVLILAGLCPLLGWMQSWWTNSPAWGILLWISPGYLYARAFDSVYQWGNASEFWRSLAMTGGTTVVCLAVANLRLPRSWQQGDEARGERTLGARLRRFRLGTSRRQGARRRLLEENPFHWLASRDRLPSWTAAAGVGMLFLTCAGLCVGGLFAKSAAADCLGFGMVVAIALHILLKWLAAAEASRRFNEDRRSGAMELLLVTPLSVDQIVEGQRRALRGAFAFPLMMACVANLALLGVMFGRDPMHMSRDRTIFVEWVVAGLVLLWFDFTAITQLGMWMGLRTRVYHRAIFATLGRVLLLPWGGLLLMWFFIIAGRMINGPEEVLVLGGVWQVVVLLLDQVYATQSRASLRTEFRTAAAGIGTGVAKID